MVLAGALVVVFLAGACSSGDGSQGAGSAGPDGSSEPGEQERWVAVGFSEDGAEIVSSPDGTTWSEVPLGEQAGDLSGVFLRGVAAFDGAWVTAGDDDGGDSGAVVLRSDDGEQWTRSTLGSEADALEGVESVSSDPALGFVVTAYRGDVGSRQFSTWTSADGEAWAPAVVPPGVDAGTAIRENGIWRSVGGDDGCSDRLHLGGSGWIDDPVPCGAHLNAAAQGADGRWVLTGGQPDDNEGLAMTSADGASWVPVDAQFEDPGVSIATDGNQWVIVGVGEGVAEDGSCCAGIWTSADGLAWNRVTASTVSELDSVAEADGTWVAAGWDVPGDSESVGAVVFSTDASTWTRAEVPPTTELVAVAHSTSRATQDTAAPSATVAPTTLPPTTTPAPPTTAPTSSPAADVGACGSFTTEFGEVLEIRTTERNEPGVELPPPTISCLRAQEVVTAYFASPDRQGSSGQAQVLGFACYTTATGGPVGQCTGPEGDIWMYAP